jgi:hypothetical protein
MTTANTLLDEDGYLETLVRERLAGRAHVRDLRVVVREQGLVLEGRAATFYAKQLAQHEAMLVTGLPLLANRIEVQ